MIVRPIRPAGGPSLADKLRVIARIPEYVYAISREITTADALHVRCPSNVSLVALVLSTLLRKPSARWFKYAGNWAHLSVKPGRTRFSGGGSGAGWPVGL